MSANHKKRRRRTAHVQTMILRDIKKRILAGDWDCGSRMPTRTELIECYSTSNVTIQKVMDSLLADGFVETRGQLGTFVSNTPPHLTRYGLVFPESRRHYHGPPSLFWRALSEVAADFPVTDACRLESYYDALRGEEGEDYRRLVDDIESHRLAGLVFASPPHELRGTPVLNAPDLSRVLIAPHDDFGGLPTVYPDYSNFVHLALTHLYESGSRRIALLDVMTMPPEAEYSLECDLRELGMVTRKEWQQYPSTYVPEGARNAVNLLMSNPADRPDGLLIFDDNLTESAALGFMDAGVRVPDHVRVVSHANFPLPANTAVPVDRIGFDVNGLLHTCIELLRRQNEGGEVAAHTSLCAIHGKLNGDDGASQNFQRHRSMSSPAVKPIPVLTQ